MARFGGAVVRGQRAAIARPQFSREERAAAAREREIVRLVNLIRLYARPTHRALPCDMDDAARIGRQLAQVAR
jgi:hypothetical protein